MPKKEIVKGKSQAEEEQIAAKTYMVCVLGYKSLNVRKTPGGEIKGAIDDGAIVEVFEERDGFAKIADGWVMLKYLRECADE